MARIRTLLALIACFVFALPALAQNAQSPQALCDAAEPADLTTMQFPEADQVIGKNIDYRAILCTSAGAIYVDLYEKLTPVTVNNFVFLAEQGYYDNTTFHRVIPDFMAQGGDPTGTGRGGPGYQFGDEPIGFLTFDRPGLLAMANAGPGTNGSQFFITTAPTPHLNYKHTIFGDVLIGQDIVEAIRERDPQTATDSAEALETVLIISDHATVDNSDVVELEPATPEEVVAAFETFATSLPPTLPLDTERSGYFATDEVAATVPAELQEEFSSFVDTHGHQYRYSLQIANSECSDQLFFSSLSFQVDVFKDAAAAEAALHDDFTGRWLESQAFEADAVTTGAYRQSELACAEEPGVNVITLYTRGRYLVTIGALVASPILDQLTPAQLLDNLAQQIEGALAEIFRGEIR